MILYHQKLNTIIAQSVDQLDKIDPSDFDFKPRPHKWSKKEILGHLIDSAYNNHQRFLRAEQQGDLIFPGYDPDDWVIKNNYQNRPKEDVLTTWITANHHLSQVIQGLAPALVNQKSTQHNFHKICMNLLKDGESTSLSYLIWDYLFHLEYHLNQIIPNYEKKTGAFVS